MDEALQLGKVVLSTPATGSANERVRHEQWVDFAEGDENALGFHLRRLVTDENLKSRLSKNAMDKYNLIPS